MSEQTMTPAEMWPGHAGHEVRYVIHGSTSWRVLSLWVDHWAADAFVGAEDYDDPEMIHVFESEFWCRDCGVELSREIEVTDNG